MPWLLKSAWRKVPSYVRPHFSITLPELGLLGSCWDSMRFTFMSLKRKGMIPVKASLTIP